MQLNLLSLLSTSVLLTSVSASFHRLEARHILPRQAFTPGTTSITGDCAANNKVACGDTLCIAPDIGDICCDPATNWGCPTYSFCLVDGKCCPNSSDPKACAVDESVTLPAGYKKTPNPWTSTPSATATGTSAASASVTSAYPKATGAASQNGVGVWVIAVAAAAVGAVA